MIAKCSLIVLIASVIFTNDAHTQVPLDSNIFWQTSETDMYSTGMVWRDCNRDGYIDVFFSNGNDIVLARNFVYLSGYGEMPVSASWASTNYEYSGHCAVGDIDDNGYPDLLVANYLGSGRFSTANHSNLYLNHNGRLNPSPDWYNADSLYSFSCALGDVDGDGDLDAALATGDGYTDQFEPDLVYFNIDGTFDTHPGWQSTALTSALDVAFGDVDNDGDLDLALCYDNHPTSIYYNHSGVFETEPSWQSSVVRSGNTLVFGDINGDGWLDLVVAYNQQHGPDAFFAVYFNDGTGRPADAPGWQSSSSGYGSALALYDYDNDGDDDLAAGRWWSRALIYENTGTTFSATPVWQAAVSTVIEELAWVDIDADGVEQMYDTFPADGRKLKYLRHHPLYSIDSVLVDGVILAENQYCFDLVAGWVSLANAPQDSIVVYYQYSFKNDLTVANWDTFNMAHANTSSPTVDFEADSALGWAPLPVQFTDNTTDALNWRWQFGDGSGSLEISPHHTFELGGAYDVSLQVQRPDGPHRRTIRKMIVVLADTMTFPNIQCLSDDTVTVPVYLTNSQPLARFTIPVSFTGETQLALVGFNTDSCRTDYFDDIHLSAYSSSGGKATFSFTAAAPLSDNPPLTPGSGPIINLRLKVLDGSGVNTLDTTSTSITSLDLNAGYVQYQPRVIPGGLAIGLCGDVDGNGSGPNLADITYLINYIYLKGPAPWSLKAANGYGDIVDDDIINLIDVTGLIGYVFLQGHPPNCH